MAEVCGEVMALESCDNRVEWQALEEGSQAESLKKSPKKETMMP